MINSDTPRTSYTLSSNATTSSTFATPAPIYSADDVSVYVNNVLKTISSPQQYSVTVATDNTATVSFTSSHLPVSGDIITITRSLAYLQEANFVNNDALDIENVERGLDKVTIMSQQLNDGRQYSFKFDTSLSGTTAFNSNADTASTLNVNKANRLNKGLKFDANGDIGVSTYDPDTIATTADTYRNDALDHRDTAQDYATRTGAVVRHFDGATNNTSDSSPANQAGVYSAKEWAVGTTASTGGSAKDWAVYTAGDVRGGSAGDMSAKEWAVGTQGRGVANEGSAKDWATYTSGTVDNSGYSALYHANAAENSAIAAKNSAAAVANVYDNFADTFLGSMADNATASSGSANGTWAKNSSSITLASTSGTIAVGQEVTGSGIPTDANVLSVDGSTIVISENMAAAGSSVSLTFTGQGVYGAFNGSKDGPATDNDGDALATGSLYFNTTDNEMRIYDGANWIAASSSGSTSILVYKYVATGGQTTFTGNDANGASLSYTVNNILVFLNGVKLDVSDFTATSGTSVVLGSGATASDELVVVAFKSFTTADMVPASTGGTFAGNVSMGDNNITNVGDIALDSISADATSITISSDMETATNKKIKQKGAFMQSSTHQALFLGY